MPGREFLELARELLASGGLPRHWRAVIIHAYYALLLECRDAMTRWKLPRLTRQGIHAKVRLRLVYTTNADLKRIGLVLEKLGEHRNLASYELRPLPIFVLDNQAHRNVQLAADALALLDTIDGDAARRAVAIASMQP
jgi:hypothetical protein